MKRNITFAIVAIAAVAFALSSCEKESMVSVKGSFNGSGQKVETPSFRLVTSHVASELDGTTIVDTHKASLLNAEGSVVEEKNYDATHELEIGTASFKRSVAAELVGKNIAYKNGYTLAGQTVTASAKLTNCEVAPFESNNTCYCHPEYRIDGAVAELSCCNIKPIRLEIKKISENQLLAEAIFGDHTEIAIPVEFAVTEDDVYGYEYDEYASATSATTATAKEYETKNGARTGKVNTLQGEFAATLTAGAEIVKTSTKYPSLNGTVGNIVGNKVSFSYSLDGTFTDNWNANMPKEVKFTTSDGKTIELPLKDGYSVKSISFEKNGNVWTNTANLYIANFVCDSDAQTIRINPVISYEYDDYATVLDPNTVGLNVYKTENGIRTGEVSVAKANYNATLTAGTLIEKTSKDPLKLKSTVGTMSSSSVSFTYELGADSFKDSWKYSATSSANFTLPNGKTVNVPVKATYSVKSTGFTANNGVYSNTATLYADNIAVASDSQKIKVEMPIEALIDGYTAIAAYITTCYHSSNNNLVSDGNHLVIVFRNDTDKSKYIVRHANSTSTTSGKDFSFNNLDENAVYSMVTIDGAMVPAYLDVIFSGKNATEWGYNQIDKNYTFPIDKFRVTTDRLGNPIIEEGKVIDGIVNINSLKVK